MNPRPDISVAIITYRHEKFVRQTLEGVAMQQFAGTVEIVIGDDLSPDGTRALLEEFAAGRPHVKLLFHPRNLGMVGNWTSVLDACTGRYVAVCEGDDYWTDPLKLQRQFDFLESHPGFSMCWHPVNVLSEGVERPHPYAENKEVADVHDLILAHFIPTCSLMFRNGLIPQWPGWIFKAKALDITLEMIFATKGKAKRLPENMGVYRQHPMGISKVSGPDGRNALNTLFILRQFNLFSSRRYESTVKQKMRQITVYQLKLDSLRTFSGFFIRLAIFRYHLFASDARSWKEKRHEMYLHLFPRFYQRFKSLF